MRLSIISPNKTIFEGEIYSATFPSMSGKFTALKDHAPIVSVLEKGDILIEETKDAKKQIIKIKSGFVEIHDNIITTCIEEE